MFVHLIMGYRELGYVVAAEDNIIGLRTVERTLHFESRTAMSHGKELAKSYSLQTFRGHLNSR